MHSMYSSRLLLASALAGYAVAQDCSTTCESSGTDFVDGGSYFQNTNSSDPFTAFEEFSGCQDDNANNILVAPNGDQWECNTTPMTPDETNQLVTCPIDKNQLYSGNWTIVVISNNGQCQPIDYMRQFYISAGVQETSTIIPSTTVISTSTPISTTLVTSTSIITTQAPTPVTTTVQKGTQKTYTKTPLPAITYTTKGVITLTKTSTTNKVVATTTRTKTSCATVQAVADRTNDAIAVTVGPPSIQSLAASMVNDMVADASEILNDVFPRATPIARSGGSVIERHIIEKTVRAPKMRVHKRHPDVETTTITDLSTTSTITQVTTAPTLSLTGTTTVLSTTTTTSTVTVVKGSPAPTTITLPQKTNTITFFVPFQTTVRTITNPVTQTVTTTATAC